MTAVEMQVEHVTLDPVLGTPVVILREKGGDRMVPIWIGQGEAAAIVSELRRVPLARPSSHDLMKELIFRLRASVMHIVVTDFQKGTFFAEIALATSEGTVCLDSRPSDAIALALRARVPIFVEPEVLKRAWGLLGVLELEGTCCELASPKVVLDVAQINADGVLENLKDEDFGKWKM